MLAATVSGDVGPADRLDTLPPWPWDILDPAAPRTLGWHAIAWAEGWSGFPTPKAWDGFPGLTQPNGPRARRPYRFTARQKRFLLWFYALDDNARWVYRQAVRRLAKGSGKSPFAAVMALIELVGPCRLETFRAGAPGGVEAKPADMAWVQIAAVAEAQTKNTMRMVRAYAPKRSAVVRWYDLDPGKVQYYGLGERLLEVITSAAATAEGAESSFVIADETEHWIGKNGHDLASTLLDNLAKSGARMLTTCNAWVPGLDSVAESDWLAWIVEEEGQTRSDARTLYDAVIVPEDLDWSDPAALQAALELVYADCDWKRPHRKVAVATGGVDIEPDIDAPVDVDSILKRIWDPKAQPDESIRKYGNRPVTPADTWCPRSEWNLLADPAHVVPAGAPIAAFFDGSLSDDATALIGCELATGHVFTIAVWELDPKDRTARIDTALVDLAVETMFDTWDVQGFYADVREWEQFAKVSWPERFADRLKVWAVPAGQVPQPIAWDMRSKLYPFTTECELVRSEITDRSFTHDGSPVLARHVGNARSSPNRWGTSVRKESPGSRLKIDACVSMIGARMVRRVVLANPEPQPKDQPGEVVGW